MKVWHQFLDSLSNKVHLFITGLHGMKVWHQLLDLFSSKVHLFITGLLGMKVWHPHQDLLRNQLVMDSLESLVSELFIIDKIISKRSKYDDTILPGIFI